MKIYIVEESDGKVSAYWDEKMADGAANLFGNGSYHDAELDMPINVIQEYMDYAGMTMPTDIRDALIFLATELGEFADGITRTANAFSGYRRHNPKPSDVESVLAEGGDVFKMLVVTMHFLGADNPMEEMLKKFKKKGWAYGPKS